MVFDVGVLFKIGAMGIAYLASFCSEICKDAGAGSLFKSRIFS